LAAFQKKILPVDDHIGIALAGLTSDARVIRYIYSYSFLYDLTILIFKSKYMQAQALSSRMNMNRPIPVQRLVTDISDSKANEIEVLLNFFLEAQVNTQQYGGRPFGVGLLIAGIDVKFINNLYFNLIFLGNRNASV
jgi:20S proteasome subunit alpha 6